MMKSLDNVLNDYFFELGDVLGKLLDSSRPRFTPSIGIVLSMLVTGIVSFSHTLHTFILALIFASIIAFATKKTREWLYVTFISIFFALVVALPVILLGETREPVVFILRVAASASLFTSMLGGLGWLGVVKGLNALGFVELSKQLGVLIRYIPEFIRKAQTSILAREARTFTVSRKNRWIIGMSLVGDLIYEGFRTSYWLSLATKSRYFGEATTKGNNVLHWRPTPLDLFALFSTILLAYTVYAG